MGPQDLLDKFYDIDNLVTVDVMMPEADWQAILNAEPRGGFGYKGKRYDYYQTTSVSIHGTHFPTEKATFSDVGIVKKSFGGSFSKTKPSLKLDFGKYNESNEDGIEDLIGTHRMTLNNSIQDPSYIRQPLGYELFRQAGVPSFRCNLAVVTVNGTNMGMYVNLEPMQKRFVEYNFNGNKDGNAYEVELIEELKDEIDYIKQDYLSFEGFSDYEDKKDILLAADVLSRRSFATAEQAVDMMAFIRFWAMENLLKHWDGYTYTLNNAYLYNNVKVVAEPTSNDVKIKFIPSGIDRILQADRPFEIGHRSVLANIVLQDGENARIMLSNLMYGLADDLFVSEKYDSIVAPLINRLKEVLVNTGLHLGNAIEEIEVVSDQLQKIRTATFTIQGWGEHIVVDLRNREVGF